MSNATALLKGGCGSSMGKVAWDATVSTAYKSYYYYKLPAKTFTVMVSESELAITANRKRRTIFLGGSMLIGDDALF